MNGTALIVIDVQQAVVEGPLPEREAFLARVADLQARARAAGVPVIHVQHEDESDPDMRRGTRGWQFHPAVAPLPGEPVVAKRECDAFFETPLAEVLAAHSATRLIICGCLTEWCLAATSRRAVALGYDVTLVSDGHGAWDEEKSAAQKIAEVNSELKGLGARLVEADQVKF